MSIVLVGSTSGSITLQEPAVAGTTVLSLPATSGTLITTGSTGQVIPKAALPTGSVLQVVNSAVSATSQSTTSSSFVSTTFNLSITPSFSSSKILILFSTMMYCGGSSSYSAATIYRNSTNLGGSDGILQNDVDNSWNPITINWLDSPATTSSITYTIYHRTVGGTSVMGWGTDGRTSMTLMEIAA